MQNLYKACTDGSSKHMPAEISFENILFRASLLEWLKAIGYTGSFEGLCQGTDWPLEGNWAVFQKILMQNPI